uniref:Uncharacterized protein n=1 Tax=Bicosoecida sp. CB-2014 TaxID=1486930 RepID=A0A7S1C353_9STRA
MAPVDRTQQVCESVSKNNDQYADVRQQIQYLFIPEGNKTHAMYWTTEYWIPELVRRGECEDFGYAMIIDDDVPLPPDLHVPLQTLARNVEIKAVSYVIMAASEDGRERQLVNFQDAEYKLAGFVKQFQWNYGSTLACHGAIGLWRRDVLGKKILWDHDTMFHGEDMYMGLLLHRMQKNYTIMVSAGAVVPTFAPEQMLILFRQRVTSWDLCAQRKFSTYVREFLSSPLNTRTLILKPFLLQEIINVILDWVRIYLMIGLGHRNMPCLILCFAIFYCLLYIEIYVFNYTVLRDRHDLRLSGRTVLLFPFYRTFSLSFRLYALLKNVLQYSTWTRKNLAISVRESEIHDMPPVPPVAHPDWWSIWQPNEDTAKDDKLRSFTKKLVSEVVLEAPQDKQRLQSLATAYLIFQKLLQENEACSFPRLLARGGQDSRGPREIARALGALREMFDAKVEEIVGASAWPGFERRLVATLQQWAGTQTMLFFVPQLANQEFDNRDFVVRSNLHVVGEITELVFATRWPKNHDKVADIKEALASLKEMMQVQLEKIQSAGQSEEMETQQRLRKMVTVLEWVKQVIEDNSTEQLADARRELMEVQTQAQSMGPDGEVVLQVVANLSRRLVTMDAAAGTAGGGAAGAAGGSTAMAPVV